MHDTADEACADKEAFKMTFCASEADCDSAGETVEGCETATSSCDAVKIAVSMTALALAALY